MLHTATDPVHRLLLECSREAILDAKVDIKAISRVTGVCVGTGASLYSHVVQRARGSVSAIGLAPSMAANRISSFWALQGKLLMLFLNNQQYS
jgi:acyl transferase domain-containing protein